MSFSIYAYNQKFTEPENYVRLLGFPYVNTIKLLPSHVLEPHAHNSLNTHFIVSGELTVWKTKEARPIKTYRAGDPPFEVTANTCYRAAAGKEGCIFVEGHKDLSPTSAKRFEDKGMITRTPAGDMVDNRKDQILCTHGRCHWSHDKVFHMCAEFGEGPSRNQVCDFK